jgi:hypothetical protein
MPIHASADAREIPVRRARSARLLRAGSPPARENAGVRDDALDDGDFTKGDFTKVNARMLVTGKALGS